MLFRKITLTQIRQYFRGMSQDILNVDVASFITQRLKKYIHDNKLGTDAAAASPLNIELLESIIKVEESEFAKHMMHRQGSGDGPRKLKPLRDEDDIPIEDKTNLKEILEDLMKVFEGSEHPDHQRDFTVIDAYNLMLIGTQMRGRIRAEIRSRGHDLELTQLQFIKTMEKKMYAQDVHDVSTFDYSRPFDQWTEVGRQCARCALC